MSSSAALSPVITPDQTVRFDDLLSSVGRTKDKQAFILLFDHFAPRVKAFLLRGGLSEAEAEELAQDTMLTVWQKSEQYDPHMAAASTWIYTVARNKKIDRLRKNQVQFLDLDDLMAQGFEPATDTPDIDWTQGRAKERLAKAIRELPEEQAALVQKAFYDDMSHAEIAAATHLPLGTVKSRLRAGLARLRQAVFTGDTK